MKKILMLVLFTFTTIVNAEVGKFTIIDAGNDNSIGGVYILNTEDGSIKFCEWGSTNSEVVCTEWFEDK